MKALKATMLALVVILCCSCGGKFKDITVTSCELKSLSPTGFSKMEAVVELGISNPAPEIHLSDIQGVAKFEGEQCLTLTTPDVVIEGKTEKTYTVTVTGRIDRSFDLLKVVAALRDPAALDAVTLDVDCHAELNSGLGKKIAKKDIPVKDLIGKL